MSGSDVRIRSMRVGDLERVCEIEEVVFPCPWSREAFETELASDRCAFPWVAEKDGEVIAYMISWLVEDELHIGNIAVAPSLQGEGVGQALFTHCLSRAQERGVSRATLEVRISNTRAIALYESHGFVPVAMRMGYYANDGEDAVVMLKAIPQPEEGA